MKEIKLKIDGIHCDNCRIRITKVLSNIDEVKEVNIKENIATIKYEKELDHNKIINTINDIGFETKEEYFIEK